MMSTDDASHAEHRLTWPVRSDLGSFDGVAVRQAVQREGCVIFRGCRASIHQFHDLVRRLGTRLIMDPDVGSRKPHPKIQQVQSVTGGSKALGLHFEFGHLPWRPSVIAFWCETSSAERGETLLCDAAHLWDEFGDADRHVLSEHGIEHRGEFPEDALLSYLRPMLGKVGVDELIARGGPGMNPRFERAESGIVRASFTVAAGTVLGGRSLLATNIFPGIYFSTEHLLGNGEPIPAPVIHRLESVARRVQVPITWSEGDVVILDNARFMHGRTSFEGDRRVFALQANWLE